VNGFKAPHVVFSLIALGSNLAGRFPSSAAAVEAAIRAIDGDVIRVAARSRLYRSLAWPDPSDPEFVNAAVSVETSLPPAELLARLHRIEAEFGRKRERTNAPRTLDLDIIDYDGLVSADGETPILPHPRATDRAFVLVPLMEVAPGWRHPATGAAISDLVASLPDPDGTTPL
jgi:2-amino-4-hydroxy-6-hydroxymethyldihydropteridine diphosphokinase